MNKAGVLVSKLFKLSVCMAFDCMNW